MSDKDKLVDFLISITENGDVQSSDYLRRVYNKMIIGETIEEMYFCDEHTTIQERFFILLALRAQRFFKDSGVLEYSNNQLYNLFEYHVIKNLESIILDFPYQIISHLSYEKYEKKSLNQIHIAVSFEHISTSQYLILLDENHQYELQNEYIHGIRKILEMIQDEQCLVIERRDSVFKITGICEKNIVKHCAKLKLCSPGELVLLVPSIGSSDDSELLKYKHGKFCIGRMVNVERLLKAYNIENDISASAFSLIVEAVETLIKSGKGAIIIFLNNTDSLERLIGFKRVFSLSPDYINPALIRNYSCIDGAIICDMDGKCLGYGAILDGESCTYANLQRGSRYNSTYNFVHKYNVPLGIVISDDGMIDVVRSV